MIAATLYSTGDTLLQLGNFDRAGETLRQAIAIFESNGMSVIHPLHSLADVELERRNLDDAETLYLRSHAASREIKDVFHAAYCLAGLACVATLRGDAERAGEYWGRVKRIEDDADKRLNASDCERYERILGLATNDAAFRRGYKAGRLRAS